MNTQEHKLSIRKQIEYWLEIAKIANEKGSLLTECNAMNIICTNQSALIDILESELATLRAELAWHPYPAEKPTEDGEYETILKVKGNQFNLTWVCTRLDIIMAWDLNQVIAFRKRPNPYQGEK